MATLQVQVQCTVIDISAYVACDHHLVNHRLLWSCAQKPEPRFFFCRTESPPIFAPTRQHQSLLSLARFRFFLSSLFDVKSAVLEVCEALSRGGLNVFAAAAAPGLLTVKMSQTVRSLSLCEASMQIRSCSSDNSSHFSHAWTESRLQQSAGAVELKFGPGTSTTLPPLSAWPANLE